MAKIERRIEGRIDKNRVMGALRVRIAQALVELTQSQQASQAGATHAETRAEGPKDMRSTEASYLARGLARRVAELEETSARLATLGVSSFGSGDPAATTALIGLEDEAGNASIVFLVPAGAGEVLEVDGAVIRPVTPHSPVGRALVGRTVGEEVEVNLPGGREFMTLEWIE
jgi:transcription elongation GreA/GreB family factor